jgi:hypothetical protein
VKKVVPQRNRTTSFRRHFAAAKLDPLIGKPGPTR